MINSPLIPNLIDAVDIFLIFQKQNIDIVSLIYSIIYSAYAE